MNYAAVGQSGIAELRYRCYENGTSCTNMNATNIIVKAIPAPAPGAGYTLIAPELNNLRAYSVSRDGLVQEAVYTPALDQWTSPVPISNGARAHVASPLGATIIQDDIWLFWFSETKQLQFATSQYTGTAWSEGMNFVPIPLLDPAWLAKPNLPHPPTNQQCRTSPRLYQPSYLAPWASRAPTTPILHRSFFSTTPRCKCLSIRTISGPGAVWGHPCSSPAYRTGP